MAVNSNTISNPLETVFNPKILLYIPNLVGYFRLVLLVAAAYYSHQNQPVLCIVTYSFGALLDGIDGWLARKFSQMSAFGAWLDVVIDNMGRTLLWSSVPWGHFVASVEWITFVCNHNRGSGWRETLWLDASESAPLYVKCVMAQGFKTPFGIWAISGLHGLPIFLYGWTHGVISFSDALLPFAAFWTGFIMLAAGRILCLMVELWCIKVHIVSLIMEDSHKS